MTHSIIHATLDHLELVVPLFDAYRVFYGKPSNPEESRSFIRSRLEKKDSVILVAINEKQSDGLGFAQLYPSFSSVAMKSIWILNDLFILSSCRRSGIGRQLMNAVSEFAASTGAVRVDLATASDNVPAKALYESTGFCLDQVFEHYKLSVK
ncbi:MAG: GNAT family N-acetyltransferase [Planctomycetales bacterium]